MSMPIVVLMGVAGSGKTTVGRAVASQLNWAFHDADDFHSAANIAKIARNEPLIDSDRIPWLESLQQLLQGYSGSGASVVLACSALKRSYRQRLLGSVSQAELVYLKGTPDLIRQRLQDRQHHVATVEILQSQFADLEEPSKDERALTVNVERSPCQIVSDITQHLQRTAQL